jgi:hypothetical protein
VEEDQGEGQTVGSMDTSQGEDADMDKAVEEGSIASGTESKTE